tara:strand:- start:290 stop:487 length:198 start_codon:yes stop_codon:yes gene_type:complete
MKDSWTCDGTEENDYDGHPLVYLHEDQDCPYCGRQSTLNAIKEGLNGISEEDIVGVSEDIKKGIE